MSKPKILFLDIETSPIITYTWGLGRQFVGINQIVEDWSILSFCAKWLGDDEVIYMDAKNDPKNDFYILQELHNLLDEADIVVGHNSDKFDLKKINARFILNDMQPPSSYRKMDTLKICRKHFGHTSNKLAYLSENLNIKFKKLDHGEFPGLELWKECLKDNHKAWKEMEKYNIHDVLALEELWMKVQAWDSSAPDFNLYSDGEVFKCNCGSEDLMKNGYAYTSVGKYQRYKCSSCGAEIKAKHNLKSSPYRRTPR